MKKRHISRATAENFRLGYAPGNSEPLLKLLERAGFTVDEAVNCGLLVHGSRGLRGLLDGRLIFPICDFQGRVLAMGGRALGDGLPKYINFSETFLYSKRRCLYGLNLARGQISREDRAIVVEGYLDVKSELKKVIKDGFGTLGLLPKVYQGVVSRQLLDKLYDKCGTYFPGPSPDMANAVALSILTDKVYY